MIIKNKQEILKRAFLVQQRHGIKYWICIIAIMVVFLVFIPYLINISYLKGMDLKKANTIFSASDILGFYGTILGSVATIIAVVLTIRYEKYQQIIGVRPFIQTESNLLAYKEDIENLTCIDKYLTYPFNKQEQVGSNINFTSDYIYRKDYPTNINQNEYLVFSYLITNAGLGGAVNVNLKVNGLMSMPKFFIGNNQYKMLLFIINKEKAETTIQILFNYTDVFNKYTYTQKEQLHIYFNEKQYLAYRQELDDLISQPEIL